MEVAPNDRLAITDTITRLIENAYDFSKPNVVERLTSLYPDSGAVISASDGRIVASKDSIAGSIQSFWDLAGRNMQQAKWVWGEKHIEPLSRTSAVMTATYTIPHRAPSGEQHIIGGAWTALFVNRDGAWRIIHEHLSSTPQRMGPMRP
jgi:hypothetical protein